MGDEVSTCRINLLQQSTYNESLAEIYQADVNSNSGAGVGTFMLDDLNSSLEISADAARISQLPTINIQSEAQEVVWTLQLYHAIFTFRPRGSSVQFGFDLDATRFVVNLLEHVDAHSGVVNEPFQAVGHVQQPDLRVKAILESVIGFDGIL